MDNVTTYRYDVREMGRDRIESVRIQVKLEYV